MRACIGEATLSPSAYSLIADLFPPKRLALALSVYGMGIYIGGGLANLAGGFVLDFTGTGQVYSLPIVGERQSWQIVFFLIALPTIPLTALLVTLREPIRKGVGKLRGSDGVMRAAKVPMSDFGRYLNSFEATYTDPALFQSLVSGSWTLFNSRDRFFQFSTGRRRRVGIRNFPLSI